MTSLELVGDRMVRPLAGAVLPLLAAIFILPLGESREPAFSEPLASLESGLGHPNNEIAKVGTQLVRKYCYQCHGGKATEGSDEFNVLDQKSLLDEDAGYVVLGDLDQSYMWARIVENEMPPSDHPQPTEDERESFRKWVLAGAPLDLTVVKENPNVPAEPVGVKSSKDIRVEGKRILAQYCGKCHPGKGNPDFDPDNLNKMLKSEASILVPGEPNKSLIWQRLFVDKDMPPARDIRLNRASAVTPEDVALLKQWIEDGAQYPGADVRKFVSNGEVWADISDDLDQFPRAEARFKRYFSLQNIHNNYVRYSDDDVRANQAALSLAINSLSQESRVTAPVKVGKSGVVWRVDLRDYGWDEVDCRSYGVDGLPVYSAWKMMLNQYPYGISFKDWDGDLRLRNHFVDSTRKTGSRMPLIRADWFVFNATQKSLYYMINRIPAKDSVLERQLGVDVIDDFRKAKLVRSAVSKSGVSVSNRLMDRHQGRLGYYWKSYDFAEAAPRSELSTFPLGPSFPGHPFPDAVFEHDGGEIIYSLPNGLQAYMLIDGKGNRIERGPTTVVGDAEAITGTPEVANAISCMNCHSNGMRMYSDNIAKDIGVFGETKIFAQRLYDPQKTLKRILEADAELFRNATQKCYQGVVDVVPESYYKPSTSPIAIAARGFRKQLSPIDGAYELGIDAGEMNADQLGAQMVGRIAGNLRLQQKGLRPWTRINGRVNRITWDRMLEPGEQSLYQATVGAFNLGAGADLSTSDAIRILNAYLNEN